MVEYLASFLWSVVLEHGLRDGPFYVEWRGGVSLGNYQKKHPAQQARGVVTQAQGEKKLCTSTGQKISSSEKLPNPPPPKKKI